MSVGNDHISVSECKRRKVYVATTPDVASDSAAELTVALILVTTRRIAEGNVIHNNYNKTTLRKHCL